MPLRGRIASVVMVVVVTTMIMEEVAMIEMAVRVQ